MKQCLMISGGPLDLCFAKEFLKTRSYDFIIAVDAGFQACLELGIHPDLLVGDFDTFGRDRIDQYLSDPAFKIDIHKPENFFHRNLHFAIRNFVNCNVKIPPE